ncbi:sigma-70 family RNA polymerase sigma factor [Streptomyces sp. PCS3-D2]|uniref:sigma-70 family RNA polymerase sigma factor n=1 Tax=Streptomyces sp. PCS3-D2 TaxID=1460244 RepID=UPI0012FF1A84|nr:sigma-70 family RNA polymerase sigma factor [Streptomyces sp. PCS3-D2]WKV75957.1 sigma-70 family RNA polymerase sigma factor [Streptomyces sp. PCS3-D2]
MRGHTAEPDAVVSDVMDEVFARHHSMVLAYARTCCRDLATAQDLAAEAFARTYRAVAWGAGPEYAWRPYLLACVRRLAATWAREASRTRLSDDFEEWAARLSAGHDTEDAVFTEEEGSLILRAYQSLPERWQAVLWHSVVEGEPAAATAARLGISAGGVGSLVARAREGLREAYLRAHLDQSASDECRHFGGQIAARLRRPGTRLTRDLGRHLQGCDGCARAQRDLRDVNGRLGVLLLGGILLWNPASFLSALGGNGTHLAAATLNGTQLVGAKAGAVKWAAATALAGTAATVAVLLPADSGNSGAGPGAAAVSTPGALRVPLPEAVPIEAIGSADFARAPATKLPSASASATPPSASTSASPSPDRTGAALVNVASGLCVGLGGHDSGGAVVLEKCTGKADQGWQRLPAHGNSYQLRNADTGTCLEGSTAGGNLAEVTLRSCRAGADRVTQLWRFETDARHSAYRVWFVPKAPRTDYADHLLGPRNWPKADPPRPGSELVHLPDYYNSVNLLFDLR